MRISDWSSDVCSSDLQPGLQLQKLEIVINLPCKLMITRAFEELVYLRDRQRRRRSLGRGRVDGRSHGSIALHRRRRRRDHRRRRDATLRSEEHTSELQSLMRISYAVFCLKKKKTLN